MRALWEKAVVVVVEEGANILMIVIDSVVHYAHREGGSERGRKGERERGRGGGGEREGRWQPCFERERQREG